MARTKLYIAGPMTGLPGLNFPEFFRVEAALRAAGYDVVNPARLGNSSESWEKNMRRAVAAMLGCCGIALLDSWPSSRGARIEYGLARALGIPAFPWAEWCALKRVPKFTDRELVCRHEGKLDSQD